MTDEEENKCLTGYKKLFCANCEADCTTSILDCNGYQLFFKGYEQGYEELEKENAELKEKLDKIRKYLVYDIFDRFKYLENLLKISQEKQEELSKCIIEQQKTTGSLTDIIYELKAQIGKM